ncbi:MAG: hypothetical protein CAF45_002075 [Nitrospira sp. CG24E]|nr:MAG: hypothetical protein CAF45_002075 [Nitrospira sp. CG24E]
MPVKYVVLNRGALVLELWTGTISHDEVLAHERRHLSDPSIAPGASVLVDATSASFETESEMVHEVTDLYRRSAGRLRVGKVALFVNESVYDRARLYVSQSSDFGVRAILFNSLDVAGTWLGIDVARAREELEKFRGNRSLV